ncbi:hypothetical protein [Actinomadura madurae]|uniref:hypothetical protein n=1 Tax=Actinomadura madurae TaxID=1993 RepID=UPI0020D26049|nr:hypothetical protein [Actinomadura madurae]MCP9968388.1 hypothetical protein [Actinomadura madurae]MCQ0007647.1 hypothetical protein [Actinomadura madurae]
MGRTLDQSGAGAAAPMSREGVDHALRELRAERDRIAASLLELDRHQGGRLLKGARLTGETWRRWEDAQARLATLWRLFDAYQRVLDAAGELRDRSSRPDAATLVELSELLSGPSVELPDGEIPLEHRTLLGPQERRITLDEAVTMMSDAYAFVAGEIAAADAAWSALLQPLEKAEEGWRDTARLAHSLDGTRHPELDRVGRELTALGRIVRTDPLSLVKDGNADTARLDRVCAILTSLGDELAGRRPDARGLRGTRAPGHRHGRGDRGDGAARPRSPRDRPRQDLLAQPARTVAGPRHRAAGPARRARTAPRGGPLGGDGGPLRRTRTRRRRGAGTGEG